MFEKLALLRQLKSLYDAFKGGNLSAIGTVADQIADLIGFDKEGDAFKQILDGAATGNMSLIVDGISDLLFEVAKRLPGAPIGFRGTGDPLAEAFAAAETELDPKATPVGTTVVSGTEPVGFGPEAIVVLQVVLELAAWIRKRRAG